MFLPTSKIGFFGGVVYPTAPIIENADMQPFATGATSFDYTTSPLTIGSNRVFIVAGTSNTPTLSSLAGSVDDTSSAIFSETTTPKIYCREMTVVSTLDTLWTLTMTGSARASMLGVVISGIDTIPTAASKTGTGGTMPNSNSFGVTGGPRGVLVLEILSILGAHVTNPPDPPTGYAIVDVVGPAGTNAPTDNNRPTLAVASRTYQAEDLSWTGDAATIPAATWQGLEDIGTQAWSTGRWVLLS